MTTDDSLHPNEEVDLHEVSGNKKEIEKRAKAVKAAKLLEEAQDCQDGPTVLYI